MPDSFTGTEPVTTTISSKPTGKAGKCYYCRQLNN